MQDFSVTHSHGVNFINVKPARIFRTNVVSAAFFTYIGTYILRKMTFVHAQMLMKLTPAYILVTYIHSQCFVRNYLLLPFYTHTTTDTLTHTLTHTYTHQQCIQKPNCKMNKEKLMAIFRIYLNNTFNIQYQNI